MSTVPQERQQILAQSLSEIRRLRGALDEASRSRTEPIAVVGMACRMPGGATDPDAFWEFLRSGGDGIGEIPPSRWDPSRFADPQTGATVRHAGLLSDVEHFDAGFFGISRREAAALDPQQRLLLEVSWEALERAGQSPDELEGTATGVFFGVTSYDYCQLVMQHADPAQLDAYALTSNASTFAAGRLSYWLGLRGPSLSVDTACSSSLVGLHLACQSLRAGETDAALAGGVNVLLSPEWFVVLDRARMLATDGRCKTFAAAADGYVRSEGCGVVVLKRLSDALAHDDRVLALIRGSAVNQDGRGSGITVPNPAAQQDVVHGALAAGGVDPGAVSYVEAHGTGTPLGDPIELRALDAVFGDRPPDAPLLVGSVKTNVGHLEPAAGMAGLIKVVCSLQHEEIPPHVHLDEVNPEIAIDELAVRIPTSVTPWPRAATPRVAGVSSFGASGTNAHVIVQEGLADERPAGEPAGGARLLAISAKSARALGELRGRYRGRLAGERGDDWADICFTAASGRAHFRHRLGVVAESAEEAARLLEAVEEEDAAPAWVHVGEAAADAARHPVVFMFTGQGAQYPAMARALYRDEPVFRAAIDRCAEILRDRAGLSLHALLSGDAGDAAIHETCNAQPALVAVEHALAELWRHWGVEPAVVLGHSVGELAAACVAGAMSLEDGLWLAARRGALMQETEPGAMTAVFTEPGHAEQLLEPFGDDLSLAAVNGPRSVVVSGRPRALRELVAQLDGAGVRSKAISTTRGFHSPLVEPVLDALLADAERVRFRPPAIELISNVDGRPFGDGRAFDAAYVRAHARLPVQFAAGLTALHDAGRRTFLEIGPAPTLVGMARGVLDDAAGDPDAPLLLPSLRPNRDDRRALLDSAAALYARGRELNLDRLDGRASRRRVVLPTYPFQRTREWLPAATGSAPGAAARGGGDVATQSLLGTRISSPLDEAQFDALLSAEGHECLGDCVMGSTAVVNIGVFLEMAIAAQRELDGPSAVAVEGCTVREPLVLDRERGNRTQLVLGSPAGGGRAFGLYAEQPGDGWRLHAEGTVGASDVGGVVDVAALRERLRQERDGAEFYDAMRARGLQLGPSARWVQRIWTDGAGETLAEMRAPRPGEADRYRLHPGLTDALFQTLFACLPAAVPEDAAYLIAGIDRFVLSQRDVRRPLLAHARLLPSADPAAMLLASAELLSGDGHVVARADGVCLARARGDQGGRTAPSRAARPRALPDPAAATASAGALTPEGLHRLLVATVARALGADVDELDVAEPLRNLGLDSLVAFEIKDAISQRLGVALPLVVFLEGHSTGQLSERIAELAGLAHSADGAPGAAGQAGPAGERDGVATPPGAQLPVIVADPAARSTPFALTELQEAYLIGRSSDFELGGIATTFVVEVDVVDLDLERAERALRRVIARHDMLRAVVTPDGMQQILDDVAPYEIALTELAGADPATAQARLASTRRELEEWVCDPATWPLFEVRATRLSADTTRLHVVLDALIIDAWSTSLMFSEWAVEYHGGQPAEPTLSFRDYVLASRSLRGGPQHAASLAYWTERAATLPPAPELPLARDPATIATPTFGHRSARLDAAQWASFREHAAAAGVTASAAICAAYAHVLATWSHSRHFTLNLLFFNRLPLHPDVDKIVGNFSATTLLEVRSVASEPFGGQAERLQRQLWSDLEHRYVSGVEVLRELNRTRREGSRAAMPVVFASTVGFASKADAVASRGVSHHLASLGSQGREVSSSIRTPQVWLDHQVVDDADSLVVNWDVVEELFADGMIDAMFAAYRGLLEELSVDAGAWSRPLPVLVPEDDLRERHAVNATSAPKAAAPRLLHDGFAAAAAADPQRCAVICGERSLDYGELDAIVRRLDGRLRAAGAGRGSLVAVVMHKGWEQVAAVLAILRCGAAYVPIDPQVPAARLALLLETTGASVAVTQPAVDGALSWPATVERLVLVEGGDDAEGPAEPAEVGPDDLAYVIFTSGSTGVPKGVMIEHGAALNTILDVNERFAVGADDRVLALSALNFDLSVWDVFGLLAVGGTIVMPDPGALLEPASWAQLVERHGVTLWNSVPALMEMFAEHVAGSGGRAGTLRLVMMSGDWIPLSLPGRIREIAPAAAQWSLGGATEASIWSIAHPIDELDPSWVSVPYGVPLRNQRFHVLDDALLPRPRGVPGELYIAGDGLARGYLADDAKTRASFIRHPATGERLYRTGDIGRYMPGGAIEFLGREDSQVKIQGFRVELGEVEAALERCAGVRSAVAVATGPARGPRRLVAYVVPSDRALVAEALLAELRDVLPAYLVPQAVMAIDELPITSNGKVDRRALPEPEATPAVDGTRGGVAPRDEIERRLAAIWGGFFEHQAIRVDADFFALGGNSLTAVRLMAAIKREWGRALALSTLFAHPTIELLAPLLREGAADAARATLVPIRQEGEGPPLIFVHPVGGDVVCYAELAAALGDVPFLALQSPDGEAGSSVRAMAEHYVAAVRAEVPHGPYLLGGWSMGGVIALEMARQLEAQGQEIALVAVVDLLEPPPATMPAEPATAELVSWFARDLAALAGATVELPPDELPADIGAAIGLACAAAKRAGALPADVDPATMKPIFERFARNCRALLGHRPEPYDGRVRFFRAADGGASAQTAAAWLELLAGDAEVIDLAGDHYSVMRVPLLDDLALALRAQLHQNSALAHANPPHDHRNR